MDLGNMAVLFYLVLLRWSTVFELLDLVYCLVVFSRFTVSLFLLFWRFGAFWFRFGDGESMDFACFCVLAAGGVTSFKNGKLIYPTVRL